MQKLTVEQAKEREQEQLLDALCNGSIELNDTFLDRNAGKATAEVLKSITEDDRRFIMTTLLETEEDKCRWIGHYFNNDGYIILRCPEICVRIPDGMEPSEYLEDPEEWTIDGKMAYTTTGVGLAVYADAEALDDAIKYYEIEINERE